jgi:hypothetical protein
VDRRRVVREAAEEFIAAIVSRDAVAITSLMSSKAQAELLRAVQRWVPTVATVEEAAGRVYRTLGRDDDDVFRLADIDGRWLVDEFPDDADDDDMPPWAFPS